jgi:hypothetical protein
MEGNGKHPPVERTKTGQFVRRHVGYGGRKPGSRGKLSEAFLGDLFSEWKKSGRSALARVAKDQPETFLRIITAVMPKVLDLDMSLNIHSELAIEVRDFAEAYERWGKLIGATPPLLEASPEDEPEDESFG